MLADVSREKAAMVVIAASGAEADVDVDSLVLVELLGALTR